MSRKSLIIKCLEAANNKLLFEDFKLSARLSTVIGELYEDQLRTLGNLIESKFIALVDSRLVLGALSETDWVLEAFEEPTPDLWKVLDAFPDSAWKFDPIDLSNQLLGLAGEKFVINELRRNLPQDKQTEISHVSLFDDSAGFDVKAPSIFRSEELVCLEIKTTSRPGEDFRFYLTRNEFDKGKTVRNWTLVFVRKVGEDFQIEGYLPHSEIEKLVPQDMTEGFKWQTITGIINVENLYSHLP